MTIQDAQNQISLLQKWIADQENEIPTPLAEPDFEPLKAMAENYLKSLIDDDEDAEEVEQYYIFEMAMDCIYGPEVWKWINSKI